MADETRKPRDEGAPDPEAARYRATTNKKQGPHVDGQGKAAETIVDEQGRARDLGRQGRAGRHDRDKDAG
jgi:hypothetical protein